MWEVPPKKEPGCAKAGVEGKEASFLKYIEELIMAGGIRGEK